MEMLEELAMPLLLEADPSLCPLYHCFKVYLTSNVGEVTINPHMQNIHVYVENMMLN